MAAVIQNIVQKVKNELDPYLHNNPISPFWNRLEQKLHVERSLIAMGLLFILAIYLIFGWGNDFVCNFIGILYPVYASLSAVQSSETDQHKHLLIYWIVYSILTCIEYLGHGLFNALIFYWLAKCIFLIWLMKSGSQIISSRFTQNTDSCGEFQFGQENQTSKLLKIDEETLISEIGNTSTLCIQGQPLTDQDMSIIANILQKVQTLTLEEDEIKSDGARYLADALRNNTTLTTLNISGNKIGSEGARHMADALRKNTTLTTLNMRGNEIESEGAGYMADALQNNTTLTTFELAGNGIRDEGAEHLAKGLRNNKTLITLNLIWNHIGDEGAKHLADALRNNTALATIDLNCNIIGDNGTQHLADVLRNNTALTKLVLANCSVGDKGVQYLVDALQNNTTLTELELIGNPIEEAGKHALETLKTNSKLSVSY